MTGGRQKPLTVPEIEQRAKELAAARGFVEDVEAARESMKNQS